MGMSVPPAEWCENCGSISSDYSPLCFICREKFGKKLGALGKMFVLCFVKYRKQISKSHLCDLFYEDKVLYRIFFGEEAARDERKEWSFFGLGSAFVLEDFLEHLVQEGVLTAEGEELSLSPIGEKMLLLLENYHAVESTMKKLGL